MLTRMSDLNPTTPERQTATARQWVAADLDRGAYLVRRSDPLAVAGQFYSPWYKLMIPAKRWPGGNLADLQDATGLYYWRVILASDIDAAVAEAEKVLAAWFAAETER